MNRGEEGKQRGKRWLEDHCSSLEEWIIILIVVVAGGELSLEELLKNKPQKGGSNEEISDGRG